MSKEVRQGLGLLAVAAICVLLAVVIRDAEGVFGVVRLMAGVFALLGLAFVAVGLLRSPAGDHQMK